MTNVDVVRDGLVGLTVSWPTIGPLESGRGIVVGSHSNSVYAVEESGRLRSVPVAGATVDLSVPRVAPKPVLSDLTGARVKIDYAGPYDTAIGSVIRHVGNNGGMEIMLDTGRIVSFHRTHVIFLDFVAAATLEETQS